MAICVFRDYLIEIPDEFPFRKDSNNEKVEKTFSDQQKKNKLGEERLENTVTVDSLDHVKNTVESYEIGKLTFFQAVKSDLQRWKAARGESARNVSLENLLKKERKQRNKDFGKSEMRERSYDILCEIDRFLSIISNYFYNFKTLFRNLSIQSLEEKKDLGEKISEVSPALKKHFKFILGRGLDWFNHRHISRELYSYMKRREVNEIFLANELGEHFRVCEVNAQRIRNLIYLKKIELLNFPYLNSPDTLGFFDEFYYSIRNNKSAEDFISKYLRS